MDDSDHHHTAEEEELAMALDGTWLLELYGLSDQLHSSPENDEDDYGFTWPSATLPAQDSAAQNQESSHFGGVFDDEAPQAVDVSRSRRVTSAPYSPPNPFHRRRLLQWFEELPAQYDAFAQAVANSPADWDPAVQRSNTSSGRYPNPARPGVAHGHFHQGHSITGSPIKAHSVEDSLIEDSIVKYSIAMDRSNEDSSIEDSSIEDSSIEDSSIEDSSIEDSSIEDSSIRDNSVKDKSIRDKSIRDSSISVNSISVNSISVNSIRDSSIRDSSIRDSPIRDSSIKHSLIEERSCKDSQFHEAAYHCHGILAICPPIAVGVLILLTLRRPRL
ncbi:hypothetical protein BJ166DRAFT_588351 [Pestalotiopsis sp. NC0098]|nr:hypothetical protein BJ166DRAFT_588351 [Pestalotiopsis sp. NC0098]